jgi:hypothetical protein
MKQKLVILSSFICFGLLAQQVAAQTTTPTTTVQPQVKKQQAPVKRWKTPVKTQVPIAGKQVAATTAASAAVDSVKNTDFSLNGQYQFLLSRSRSINGYKLVNPYRLTAVWKSVIDTLAKERAELIKAKGAATGLQQRVNALQAEVKGNETAFAHTNAKIDEINVLGMPLSKSTYSLVVWALIVLLTIGLIVVIARSGKNNAEAKHSAQRYDEITAEYQAYKAKASEKERKLARELQDERNIIEEMKGKR